MLNLTALIVTAAAMEPQLPYTEPQLAKIVDVASDGPGCALAIVQDRKLVFAKGYGLADLETRRPITPQTTFNIASMTKQFTGMAIALLIADGKLREADDIRRHLPELRDYGSPIRIAHLLNHSSGLRNHMALAAFQPGDHLPSHEEALRLVFRQSALNFTPGARHQYESPNYVLLAEIVGRASGMPYERFLQERIFTPLGMAATGFASPSLARAYAKAPDGQWTLREMVNRARGSSGLLSGAADFANWLANYDTQSVGGGAAATRMLSTSTLADGTPLSYRYGLVKEFDYAGVKGLTRISHSGQTAAYRSAFSYFPGRGMGHVVLCNYGKDARAIDQALVDALVGPPKEAITPAGLVLPLDQARRLAGVYYSVADDVVREFGTGKDSLTLKAFGGEFPLRHLGGSRFALDGAGALLFTGGRYTEAFDGQARLGFARLPPVAPQPIVQFAGNYRSADVDGPVRLAVEEGKLTLTYPAGKATLRQIARDHFASPSEDFQSVRFHRDKDGEVSGLSLTVSSGITRLRFVPATH